MEPVGTTTMKTTPPFAIYAVLMIGVGGNSQNIMRGIEKEKTITAVGMDAGLCGEI